MTKPNFAQMVVGDPSPFFADDGRPFAPPVRGGRAFFGRAANHQMLTDRTKNSTSSIVIPETIGSLIERTFTFTGTLGNYQFWPVGGDVIAVVTETAPGHADALRPRLNYMRGVVKAISETSITATFASKGGGGGTFDRWEISFVDPLSSFSDLFMANGVPVTGWDYLVDLSGVVNIPQLGNGFGTIVRTSNGTDAIGYTAGAIADAPGRGAWGGYLDAIRTVDGVKGVMGMELEIANIASSRPHGGVTPYQPRATDMTFGLGIGSGSDRHVFGRSFAADAAINTGNNGGAFWTGWNAMHDAIMRENTPDDRSAPTASQGFGALISMASDIGFRWYSRDPTEGTTDRPEVFRFSVNVTDPLHRAGFYFGNGGASYRERSGAGHDLVYFGHIADAAANIRIDPAALGGAPSVRAVGANPHINLMLSGKGEGTIFTPGIREFANDAAALAGGIPLNGWYRTGNQPRIRIV